MLNIKKKIIGLFFLYSIINVYSQNIQYVNESKNEFLFIIEDSIFFRFNFNDAFGTYAIGKGIYILNSRGKYIIDYNKSLYFHTSKITKIKREDSGLTFKALYHDSTEINYFDLNISNENNRHNLQVTKGYLYLSDKQLYGLLSDNSTIFIDIIGFATKQILNIEYGYDYIIQSLVLDKFPFAIITNDTNLQIKNKNENEVVVKIGKRVQTTLKKSETEILYNGFIYNIDFLEK